MRFLHPTEKAHLCVRSHERGEAQTSHRRWHIVDMQAKPRAKSLGRLWQATTGRDMPP